MAAAVISSAGLPLFPKGKTDTADSGPSSAAQNEKNAEREPVFTYTDNSAGGSVDESGEFTDESVTDGESLAISSESGNSRQKIQERPEQLSSQSGEKAKEKSADRTTEPVPENDRVNKEADSAEKTGTAESAASPAGTDSARNRRSVRTESDYLQDYIKPAPDTLPPEKVPERELSMTDEADADGVTGLMRAARSGNDWQIRALLGAGAEINAKDKNGWTALMYASRWQENLNTVNMLVSAGSDVKATDQFGTDALILAACRNGNPDILRKLLEFYGAADRQVMRALTLVLSGTDTTEFTGTEKVRVFMEKGVPLNIYLDGRTPLMYAAKYGKSAEILEILVENNAATELRSAEGKTALDYAMENPRLDTEKIHRILNR